MSNESDENLRLIKDAYSLRIKTIIASLKEISLEKYLQGHIKINPKISPYDLFTNSIWFCVLAVEYTIKEKDTELLGYIDRLIQKLESEEGDGENIPLGKIFARLLMKAKNVCEATLPVPSIVLTFEFNYFLEAFKERIIKKMFTADKSDIDKFYGPMTHYSNN